MKLLSHELVSHVMHSLQLSSTIESDYNAIVAYSASAVVLLYQSRCR